MILCIMQTQGSQIHQDLPVLGVIIHKQVAAISAISIAYLEAKKNAFHPPYNYYKMRMLR